jgi:hypothetical protein
LSSSPTTAPDQSPAFCVDQRNSAIKKMGRTLAMNPGSVYGDGVLQGAVLELDAKKGKVSKYLLVNG